MKLKHSVNNSIHKKFILYILTIMVIFQGTFLFVNVYFTRDKSYAQLQKVRTRVMKELSETLPIPLWNFNLKRAQSLIFSKLNEQAFMGITIQDIASKEMLVSLFKDSTLNTDTLKLAKKDFLKLERKVKYDDTESWLFTYYFTDYYIRQLIYKSIFVAALQTVLLSLFLFFFLTFLISRQILKPLNETSSMLEDIAQGEGDLTKELQIKHDDEIGLLARFFNQFIQTLSKIIISFKNSITKLNGTSENMSTISEDLNNNSQSLNENVKNLKSNINSLNTSMDTVTQSARESSSNLEVITESAKELLQAINAISTNAESAQHSSSKAVDVIQKAKEMVENLDEKSRNINSVIDSIVDISDLTKLLALNATIEASHAGEAGKGFQVVANEVKELARRASDASELIKNDIEKIQETTNSTVNEIQSIFDIINEVNDINSNIVSSIYQQKRATEDITNNTQNASMRMNEVVTSIQKTTVTSNDIWKDTQQVYDESLKVKEGSFSIKANESEMLEIVTLLTQLISKFKL